MRFSVNATIPFKYGTHTQEVEMCQQSVSKALLSEYCVLCETENFNREVKRNEECEIFVRYVCTFLPVSGSGCFLH